MMTAKVFENGRRWSSFMQAIDMFSEDFMEDERTEGNEQERVKGLKLENWTE